MEILRDKKGVKAYLTCVQKTTIVSFGGKEPTARDKQRAALCETANHVETFTGHAKISG